MVDAAGMGAVAAFVSAGVGISVETAAMTMRAGLENRPETSSVVLAGIVMAAV
jgi:hypothetical protein